MEQKKLVNTVNKIYKNQKILFSDLENFINQLEILKSKINKTEREEHLKLSLLNFFKNTFYQNNEVNIKHDINLTIYNQASNNSKPSESKVGVIIETKTIDSKEMITKENFQAKSMYQCLLYYLQERINEQNNDLKHIIITNFQEWFIFDATDFEKSFYEDKELRNEFENWNNNKKTSRTTNLFYNEIAPKYIKHASDGETLQFVHFDLNNVEKHGSASPHESSSFIQLYKIFSQQFLLKKSFANDSNTLDTKFYYELLHIIGLEECKENGKKIINRKKVRQNASLIENTISIIATEDRLEFIEDIEQYGTTKPEQIENIALELNILWINRIIFLKLIEAQLISYHNNSSDYKFLNFNIIQDFDELNELFFRILAQEIDNRPKYLKEKFEKIPYINSSLFEISNLEKQTIRINSLKSRIELSLFSKTVLKNIPNQSLSILQYLYQFLDAFDFTSANTEEIQKEQKNLINASVLGLIFEKINGYKEGSYFTPGYITMYINRETIRAATLQKFKTLPKFKTLEKFDEIKNKLEDRKQANEIINSLKICDPAVGSGHFLVSALNEIIAIKSELGILQYRNGNPIINYKAEVVNDELIITNKFTEEIFEYNLSLKGNPIDYKQELQEAIFHEKETIIENCLFGVDINPNSVNICRLRLWIELLKNSYYRVKTLHATSLLELQTLPNIDINIKQGNSLVSKFALNGNGHKNSQGFKNLKSLRQDTQKYKEQVIIYKSTNDKTTKKNAEKEIARIKEQFSKFANPKDNDFKILREQKAKLIEIQSKNPVLMTREDLKIWKHNLDTLPLEINKLELEFEKKQRTIYGKALEWRFEFPEVLDENGNFEGFDIVVGNPPYIGVRTSQIDKKQSIYFKEKYQLATGQYDLFALFIELSYNILRKEGFHSFIIPKRFVANQNFKELRNFCVNNFNLNKFADSAMPFNNTNVESCIIFNQKGYKNQKIKIDSIQKDKIKKLGEIDKKIVNRMPFNILPVYISLESVELIHKIIFKKNITQLGEIVNIIRGFEFGYNHKSISKNKNKYKVIRGSNIFKYAVKYDNYYVNAEFKNTKVFKKEKYFLQIPKLVTRFVSNELIFSYDNVGYCNTNVVYNIHLKNKNFNLKYLLALLNSKLLNFYFFNIYSNNDKVFPHIQKNQLATIPIKSISKSQQLKLVNKVDKILKLKEQKADTTKLENEIDKLVYKLYNLTKSEIKIIENETT